LSPSNSSDFNCGSPFFANTSEGFDPDALTATGDAACSIEGGLANRRAAAFSLLGGGAVLLIAALVLSQQHARPRTGRPVSDTAPDEATDADNQNGTETGDLPSADEE
jgi:hypothetical protein